jgi:SAM-dependent methyltransferase
VLRGCKRILKPGGRLVFTVVATTDASTIPPDDVLDDFVSPADDYLPLVEAAGFTSIEHSDITDAFHTIMLVWLEVVADLEDDLRSALGDDVFDDKLASRRDTLVATEAGELRRLLFTATA